MKRHRFDPISFLFGAIFLTVGVTYLFGRSGATATRPEHLWPPFIVIIGVALALWALAASLRRAKPDGADGAEDAELEAEPPGEEA